MTMNHRYLPGSGAPTDALHQLSKSFSSNEGYRIVSNVVSDEYKLLQETKKILERRVVLDEQYARNLQELTADADRVAWPVNTHAVASASREVFLHWSRLATIITSNAGEFRRTIINDLLKELIEHKIDSKKCLEDEKRRYDAEHRKAQTDVVEAERRYLEEARSYHTKNMELTKFQTNARKADDSRLKHLKDSVLEKRGHVYRAHNEYVIKIREYNFIDKQYVYKVQNLLIYHEEIQLILNKTWQNLLESIANYTKSNRDELANTMESLRKTIFSADPRRCYDEICKIHSINLPLTTSPQVFNELLLQTSGLTKLKPNKFIGDNATRLDMKQRIEKLETSINEPIPKIIDLIRERQMSYFGRKNVFEQEQQIDNCQKKKEFDKELRDDLHSALTDVGFRSDDDSDPDPDDDLSDRLEDQPYFHGVLPRHESISKLTEKGDYLIRINEQGKIVLSILWTDPDNLNNKKDGHFFIHEFNQMYSLTANGISKPSVPELISYYKRQKLDLRDDGTRLIRPVTRPDYMINNDEVHTLETLGKGHFGQVARAEYRGKFVAVKILLPSSADRNARERQNFINEALLLRQYKHKNIVKFLGIAAIRDPLMIMMELIEQGSLNNHLRNNDLRVSQLIQMCYDIAKGMEYLEKNNVIHRDLAARNCLIDKKGRVKVSDFGLSRSLQSDEEYFCQIKEVPVRWWAVEVFSNSPYTNKSDVWSYGITAWEVFSKADIPYAHILQNHSVIDAVKYGERLKQPEKCSSRIYTIMTSCWFVQPKDRPNFEKLIGFFSDMPHLLISTKIRLEPGPTIVGDERADPEIMAYLGATLFHEKCNDYSEYRTSDCARVVLDNLEKLGYHVISMTGIGQTCVWLLHKD